MDPLLSCKHLRGCLSFHLHLQVPTFPYCRVENFFYFNSLGAVFWGDKEGHFFASTLTHPSDPKGLRPSSLRLAPCHQDVQDVFSSTLVLKPLFFHEVLVPNQLCFHLNTFQGNKMRSTASPSLLPDVPSQRTWSCCRQRQPWSHKQCDPTGR